jgi:cephalosporin hydroxylase
MKYTYRGVPCLKDPLDLALYIKLIYEVKPGTIFEIGSFNGGSAILFGDISRMYGLNTRIITIDFRDVIEEKNPHIEYIVADAMHLADSPLDEMLKTLPRPWLVIEDSAHTFEVCYAVLDYFKDKLFRGEYLVIEDGVIEDQGANHRYDGGPNRAIYTFFCNHPDIYEVDESYTDFFGVNATFNPNGYLRKK